MNLIDAIAMEYEQESKLSRKAIERVPDDKLAWKPHPKSKSLGELASHLADQQRLIASILTTDTLDASGYKPFQGTSRDAILKKLDENVAASQAAMKGVSDDKLMQKWTMKRNGQTMMEMPRAVVLRFFMNHQIHHRGQLTVYLRLNEIPVPATYGPSADEKN